MFKFSGFRMTNKLANLAGILWMVTSIIGLVVYLEKFGYDAGYGIDRNMKHIFVGVSFLNLFACILLLFGLNYESRALILVWLTSEAFCLVILTVFFTVAGMFKNLSFAIILIPIGIGYVVWGSICQLYVNFGNRSLNADKICERFEVQITEPLNGPD